MRWHLARCLLAATCPLAAAAEAASTGFAVDLEAGLVARDLREHAEADGGVLVRETAVGPRVGLAWTGRGPGPWRPTGRLDAWAADARYDGRSQAGAPVDSRTGTGALRVEGALRYLMEAEPSGTSWLEAGLQVEHFVRRIRGVGPLGGLDERTLQSRVAVGAGGGWANGTWRAMLVAGPRAPLRVRFDADVFDVVHLRSGAVRGLALEAAWPTGPNGSIVLSAEHLRVGPSETATLQAGGQPAGTVRQPAWTRQGLGLALRRSLR